LTSPSRIRLFYLLHLSKPVSDRLVYREVRRLKARKILEIGMGCAERALRMIEMATAAADPREIRYTGIDLFEDRSTEDGPGLSLREAHRELKTTNARIQLVPGTPQEGLARCANALGKLDLIVVSSRTDPQSLAAAWFYVPRLLADETVVLRETPTAEGSVSIRALEQGELQSLASPSRRRKAA
jgi:hypothetical protein